MKHLIHAAAFALLATPTFAQDTTALAQDYVDLPAVQSMITAMFSPETMGEQMANSLPPSITLSPAQQTRIGEVMSAAMNKMRPRLEELMVSGSAETFTAAELDAMIAFYQTEHGAAILTKSAPFMTKVMGALAPEMQALQTEVGPEINKILQEK